MKVTPSCKAFYLDLLYKTRLPFTRNHLSRQLKFLLSPGHRWKRNHFGGAVCLMLLHRAKIDLPFAARGWGELGFDYFGDAGQGGVYVEQDHANGCAERYGEDQDREKRHNFGPLLHPPQRH
jgi:hypothetical protein